MLIIFITNFACNGPRIYTYKGKNLQYHRSLEQFFQSMTLYICPNNRHKSKFNASVKEETKSNKNDNKTMGPAKVLTIQTGCQGSFHDFFFIFWAAVKNYYRKDSNKRTGSDMKKFTLIYV